MRSHSALPALVVLPALAGLLFSLANTTSAAAPAAAKVFPSVWIEAEDADETNFLPGAGPANITPESPGNSGAAFLTLAAKKTADGSPQFFADYRFRIKEAGTYRLWAAVSPQDVDWTSPFTLTCDDGPAISLENRHAASGRYGNPPRNQFEWIDAGTVTLTPGEHVLRLETIRPRTSARDNLFHAFADAFLLTQELDYVPSGAYPKYTTQRPWAEVIGDTPWEEFVLQAQLPFYRKKLAGTEEGAGEEAEREVLRKLMARPLPAAGSAIRPPGRYEFGVHGMEAPFVRAGVDTEKVQLAYELLARAGVQSFRTAESCWSRLGRDYDNFTELDYQVENAVRFGMTQMFTVGYPPGDFRVGKGLSAVRPEFFPNYRDYLKALLTRYAGRGIFHYVELANEVDALRPWWVDSTPAMYVDEMRMVKEALVEFAPGAQTVAFGATYSRNEQMGGPEGGRRFVRQCLDLGINDYVDVYSLHYTWKLSERDFPAFFHRELTQRELPPRPLMNSEETSHGPPSDIIKLFARDFLLHGMVRVDYFMSKDWFELGSCQIIGLFDLTWKPKRRLLAYAAAVDTIQHRELLGMAEPAPGVEAYVLRWAGEGSPVGAEYATVLWDNAGGDTPSATDLASTRTQIVGWREVVRAMDWKLDPVAISDSNGNATLEAETGGKPVIVFSKAAPDWKLVTPAQWLERIGRENRPEENIVPSVPL
ncbi:hypothetical protein OpiT1DRAFT_02270 [Opitutaceae bacterium TAV1]|nr:hypothetical protein OpiT1DRAFT_02270 [Opitutaceae bacterium TAV1]